jgi:pimeloyl-ACP methyl ester carboxylesterase
VALALGARHPALVRAVALVATPAPHEDVPWIPDEYIAMMDALRADLPGATGALTGVFAELAADPAAAVDDVAVGPADEAALAADPSRRRRLDAMLTEAFAPGAAGLAADIVSYTLVPWGFDPMSVGAPTSGFYGAEDTHVTPAHGDWYAERVPDADLRIVPGIAHLVVMTAWPEILSVVA